MSSCSKPYRADGTGGPSRFQLEEAIKRHDPSAKVLKSNPTKEELCRYMTRHNLAPTTIPFDASDRVCGSSYDPLTNLREETIRAMATTYNERNPTNKIHHIALKNKMELCHDLRQRGQSVAPVMRSPSVPSSPMFSSAPTLMPSAPMMMTDLQRCSAKYSPKLKNRHLTDLRDLAMDFNKTQPEANRIKNVSVLSKDALCAALHAKGQSIVMQGKKKHHSHRRRHSHLHGRRSHSRRRRSHSRK